MHVSPFVDRFEFENLKLNLKENHLHHLRTQTALIVCLTSLGEILKIVISPKFKNALKRFMNGFEDTFCH